MRRQVIVWAVVGIATVTVIGLVVFGNQQGWFGGKAHQLLALATRDAQQGNFPEAQARLEELLATFPDSPWTDDGLMKLGDVYEAQQQLAQAHATYRTLLEKFPTSPFVSNAQARLGHVNVALLFSPAMTELDQLYEVKEGDSLGKIAATHDTTVELLQKANGLKGAVIRPHQKLKVPKGRFTISVDKSQNQLLLTEDNQFVKSYRVATGKDNSTPVGTFKIINKITNPIWYKQGAVVPPESQENILGTRWLGLDKQGYGIHGSVDPNAIGQHVTAGCVRMTNSDVEELFAIVPVGTEVTIVD